MAKVCIEAVAAGIRLKEYRERNNLSLNKLGVMAGTDPKHIKKIENGQSEGTLLWYFHIMYYFGLDISHLFDERFDDILLELIERETVNEDN